MVVRPRPWLDRLCSTLSSLKSSLLVRTPLASVVPPCEVLFYCYEGSPWGESRDDLPPEYTTAVRVLARTHCAESRKMLFPTTIFRQTNDRPKQRCTILWRRPPLFDQRKSRRRINLWNQASRPYRMPASSLISSSEDVCIFHYNERTSSPYKTLGETYVNKRHRSVGIRCKYTLKTTHDETNDPSEL